MKRFLLILPDEDGNHNRFLTAEELKPYLDGEESCEQITRWRSETDALSDPSYWQEGEAALFEVRPIIPTRTKAWVLEAQ